MGHDIGYDLSWSVSSSDGDESKKAVGASPLANDTTTTATAIVDDDSEAERSVAKSTSHATAVLTMEDNVDDSNDRSITDENDNDEPILLLNGFGVGSFHQHRLIPHLLQSDESSNRLVYCIDYLGQGKSWPINCEDGMGPNEKGLIYSAET